ncbi:putative E3 ubiquitin-protein ligase UNKL isoform X1 [Dermacentor silvarum]|uniref:putative E3 ubiquitin-protein ligase UNKL isoform X1 n=1 Tax=Dermacentor silvarum TaxID=543639 RepID=UPI001896E7FB|nr:putative E3 ubiquitin-protein ligase UNKL isoform X1 [Dermacentor silvarum]
MAVRLSLTSHAQPKCAGWQEASKMPSTADQKTALPTQTEKPNHYNYLKEFRVEQCPLFVQHKCTQHKPFTCFHWHFKNQRRRRPIRLARDGTFNYSPDVYCTNYDETTGICPDGDGCRFLHRTAGDTERRYHLRYYKTGICVYDTDARGNCVKNGPHCAFAHGLHDLRSPVYDAKEQQACLAGDGSSANGPDDATNGGPNSLDKERNALNEDPHWQDTKYVLTNYKTEPCKRPPRLCRQGYACPQYHNSRDKRRSPKKYKYRSTPCPNVKQGDEWGDPANCDNGDSCSYCHTRTEQQFHPEIYKSTKCNDMQQANYCPRGPFCAFAHVEKEISAVRDLGPDYSTNLAAILSSALPSSSSSANHQGSSGSPACKNDNPFSHVGSHDHMAEQQQQHAASLGEKAWYAAQANDCSNNPLPNPIGRPRSYSSSTNHSSESLPLHQKAPGSEREDREASIRKQLKAIDNEPMADPLEKARLKQDVWLVHGLTPPPMTSTASSSSSFYHSTNTVESVVGVALDDLSLEDINVEASIDKDLENDSNPVSTSITQGLTSSGLLGSSAPMNIPGASGMHCNRRLGGNMSPPVGSLPHSLGLQSSHDHAMDKAAAAFYSHSGGAGSFSGPKYPGFPGMYDFSQGALSSPSSSHLLWDDRMAPKAPPGLHQPMPGSWEEGLVQARAVYEAWKREVEEAKHREKMAECQRDEALGQMALLQKELEALASGRAAGFGPLRLQELEKLPATQLRLLQEQLRADLDAVDKVLYQQQCKSKCLVCQQHNRSVAVLPCNHLVLCGTCAAVTTKCPYCSCDIARNSLPMSL